MTIDHDDVMRTDKTIKLWKVFEKSLKVVAENNHMPAGFQPQPVTTLKLPRMAFHDTIIAAVPRKVYANAHAYHINSISINSDGETYLSADDLRINLWNLGTCDQSFSLSSSPPHHLNLSTTHLLIYPRFLSLSLFGSLINRHLGYQTCKYGRVDRGHHRR
jgi:hypothetical protein